MKRHGNLYNKITTFENICEAYRKAALGRRYTYEVLSFRNNLEENLIAIQEDLVNRTYKPGPYWTFTLYEPKERLIYVSPFRDRVVHHAIMNVIEPIWNNLFIYDSYACRKMKGSHAAMYRVVKFFREGKQQWDRVYCLIKHRMRVKFYVRYMDDFVLLDGDKLLLHAYKAEISDYLNTNLCLQMNPKSDIYPADRGIDFVGYRIWPSYRLVRKKALVRATKRFKRLSHDYEHGLVDLAHVNSSVMSWFGHCGHSHFLNAKIKCLEALVLRRPTEQMI